jgi:hypothetical protein
LSTRRGETEAASLTSSIYSVGLSVWSRRRDSNRMPSSLCGQSRRTSAGSH